MNDDNLLGGVLGQLGHTVKKAGQQVVKLPQEMVRDAGGQIGSAPLRQGSEGQAKPDEKSADNKPQQEWQSDEERVKFLRGLYGPDRTINPTSKKPTEAEEQKKLLELRKQLHKENYYDPTFNPVRKQEERASEKVENEKREEMVDLQKKEENKPPPLAVVREQNKTEMFRGAAG